MLKKKYDTNDPIKIAEERDIIIWPNNASINFIKANTYKDREGRRIITINSSYDELSRKILCAHELGHALFSDNSKLEYPENSIRIYVFIRNAVDLDVSMVNRTERSEGEFKELTHAHCHTLFWVEQPVAVPLPERRVGAVWGVAVGCTLFLKGAMRRCLGLSVIWLVGCVFGVVL